MTLSPRTHLFERYPALTLVVIVSVASFLIDLGLTSLYRIVKHGTIHYRVTKPSTIRIASSVFHHTLKPNSSSENEGWGPLHPTLFTNSLGFKDKSIRAVPLIPDHYRIMFMGDSFTEGVGYDYPQTFVGLIDNAIASKGIEVLNAGVVGYSPAIYHRKTEYLLDTLGLRFNTMVLFLDVSDPIDEIKSYTIRDEQTILTPEITHPIAEFLLDYTTIPRHLIKLTRLITAIVHDPEFWATTPITQTEEDKRYGTRQERSLWTIDQSLYDTLGRQGLARAERHMNLLHSLLSAHQIPLVLVIYPWPDQIVHHDLDSVHMQFWRKWATTHSVAFINLFPDFISDTRRPLDTITELFIRGDTHWNDKGHRFVAHRILQELNLLLPARPSSSPTQTSPANR